MIGVRLITYRRAFFQLFGLNIMVATSGAPLNRELGLRRSMIFRFQLGRRLRRRRLPPPSW